MFTPCADVEIVTYLGYQTGVLIDEKHAIALHTVFGPVDPEALLNTKLYLQYTTV